MIKHIFILFALSLVVTFTLNAQVTGENVSTIVYRSEQKVTLKHIKEKKWAIYLEGAELKDGYEYGFWEAVAFDEKSITFENSEHAIRYTYDLINKKVYISEIDFNTMKFMAKKLAPNYTILSISNDEADKEKIAANNLNNKSAAQGLSSNEVIGIGSSYQGGIVFYLNGNGKHGLIVSKENIDKEKIDWDNQTNKDINKTKIEMGSGAANTNAIINVYNNSNYAANICKKYNGGGFNDWYLPSLDELKLIYENVGPSSKLKNIGKFNNDMMASYWSSSESPNQSSFGGKYAWAIFFNDGTAQESTKNSASYVRAIRAF
jgi:hypothetical protein